MRFHTIDDVSWLDWYVWDFGRAADAAQTVGVEMNGQTRRWRPTRAVYAWLDQEVGDQDFIVDAACEKLYIYKHSNVMAFVLRWSGEWRQDT